MQPAALQHWLRKKAVSETATGALFTAGCLVLGGIVLLITYFFTYAIVWFGFNFGVSGFSELIFNHRLHLPHAGIVAVSLAFLALLFWANQRISREYLDAYPRRDYAAPFAGLTGLTGSLISLLAYPGASTRMITDLLLTGPRLVMIAWSNAGKSSRLTRMNVEACSRVLAVLQQRAGRVSFAELTSSARLANPEAVFRQLRDLDGVVFLREEPIGLSLTSELREELAGLSGQIPQPLSARAVETRPVNLPPGTIHELLGVPSSASSEEIDVAYRNWMTQSCVRQAASAESAARKQQLEEHVKAVNAAYEAFLAKHKAGETETRNDKVEGVWEQFKRSVKRQSL
jgi:hypothetical protein